MNPQPAPTNKPREESSEEEAQTISWRRLGWLLAGVVTLWAVIPLIASCIGEDAGKTGDSFGSVNAFFTGLAFAGLIYTVFLQRHELRLQRRELELTREVLKEQKAEMQASTAAQLMISQAQSDTARIMREQADSQRANLQIEALRCAQVVIGSRIATAERVKEEAEAWINKNATRFIGGQRVSHDPEKLGRQEARIGESDTLITRLEAEMVAADDAILEYARSLTATPSASTPQAEVEKLVGRK